MARGRQRSAPLASGTTSPRDGRKSRMSLRTTSRRRSAMAPVTLGRASVEQHGLPRARTAECGNGPSPEAPRYAARTFVVDEPAAEAIRRAYDEGGELAGAIEFKHRFPLISDNGFDGQ